MLCILEIQEAKVGDSSALWRVQEAKVDDSFCVLEIRVAKVDDSSALWRFWTQELATFLHSGAPGRVGGGSNLVQSWYNHGTIMVRPWYNHGAIVGSIVSKAMRGVWSKKSRISVSKALFAGRARAVLRTSV